METRPANPTHGDFARGWETLSRATSGSARSPTARRPSPTTSARARTAACTSSSALGITFLESDAEAYSFRFG
jgi:hypothetical protein